MVADLPDDWFTVKVTDLSKTSGPVALSFGDHPSCDYETSSITQFSDFDQLLLKKSKCPDLSNLSIQGANR